MQGRSRSGGFYQVIEHGTDFRKELLCGFAHGFILQSSIRPFERINTYAGWRQQEWAVLFRFRFRRWSFSASRGSSGTLVVHPHITMLKKLNGWQRIGIVLSVAWLLSISGVALFQFFFVTHPRHCLFVYDAIPAGTVWTPMRDAKGAPIPPWNYDWESDDNVPKTRTLRVGVFTSALTLPLLGGWLLSFSSIRAFKWVREGFKVQH